MAEAATRSTGHFGPQLRQWRQTRHLSQLDLAMASDVSARHISFLETGRANPSRAMVLHLSELLQIPLSARNALLGAAGFAPAYAARALNDNDMQPIDAALCWTLERHAPFPALLLDRHWRMVRANRPAAAMLAPLGVRENDSMLDVFGSPERMAALLDNWEEVARHMVTRLRTEALHLGGDAILEAAVSRIDGALGRSPPPRLGVGPAIIPIRMRMGAAVLSLFSVISQFGSTEDIALVDLKLELFYPADDATRRVLMASGAH